MRLPLILLAGMFLCATVLADDAPRTFRFDGNDLLKTRQRYRAGDEAVVKMVKSLLADADKAVTGPTFSVVNKKATPPSGDKHDYMSLSPYWWPDPSKPDGKPYIRKDGQTNPERLQYDQPVIEAFADAMEALSLAYYFSGDEKYAQKAAELIRVW